MKSFGKLFSSCPLHSLRTNDNFTATEEMKQRTLHWIGDLEDLVLIYLANVELLIISTMMTSESHGYDFTLTAQLTSNRFKSP